MIIITPFILWIGLALICIIAELLSGTFYLLFIGGAFLVGALTAWLDFSITAQYVAASMMGVIGVGVVYYFKPKVKARRYQTPYPTDQLDIGQNVLIHTIHRTPGHVQIFYRGAYWDAQFDEPVPNIKVGDTAYITGQQGNTFFISLTPLTRL